MTSLQEVEKFWSRVCFDRSFPTRGRFQVYRELVTERMIDVLQNICPVTNSILGETEWQTLLWDYLKKSPPVSEILRELPFEVAQYLKTHRHPLAKKYPYLGELIEYEFLEVRVRFATEDLGKTEPGRVRLNPAHHLAEYRWPVHFIDEDFSDPKKMPKGPFHLLIWRQPVSLEVQFMEVNLLTASLLRHLTKRPKSPQALLRSVTKEHGISPSKEYFLEGEALLADLQNKQIILNR